MSVLLCAHFLACSGPLLALLGPSEALRRSSVHWGEADLPRLVGIAFFRTSLGAVTGAWGRGGGGARWVVMVARQ